MTERRAPTGQGPARGLATGVGSRPGRRPARRAVQRRATSFRSAGDTPGPTRLPARAPALGPGGTPAGSRRGVGPARRTKAPRAPRRVSGRAAAIGLLLVAFTLAYAYPVRIYLSQQAEIGRLEVSQTQQRQRIADLQARIARWDDPDYVITQARSRLQLVRKGELIYVVKTEPDPPGAPGAAPDSSWFTQLWSTVQGADNPDGS